MSGIDDGVISLDLDNEDFLRRIGPSLDAIDKLQKSLDFTNSQKSLNDLSAAGKAFDMGDVGGKVDGVSNKFLALATVGITTLATITTHAVEAGGRMLKAFTMQPIMDGFHEFETNANSIQTILANTASKGSKLSDVNAALDQLNTYSDQTIYNFSEMARNIGTFTAAGVGLKESTQSIKGIANIAAISGSSSEQASTAMYQLSQAIASGTVKLMDWNSVVNAGMGGEVFQKALFESGKAMKTLKNVPMGETFDEWKKKGNSFRDSLQDGWITSEVLTKTLAGFTGDLSEQQLIQLGYTKQQADEFLKLGASGKSAAQDIKTFTQLIGTIKEAVGSGWSSTFRILVGDFGEAKQLFTSLGNVIGGFVQDQAKSRNDLLQGWKDLGGRTALIQGLTDVFKGLGTIIFDIRRAFGSIFPPHTSQDLFNLTKGFANFAAIFKDKMFDYIPRVTQLFKGLFAGVDIVKEVIKGVIVVIANFIGSIANVSNAGGGILNFLSKIAGFLINIDTNLVKSGKMMDFFNKIGNAVRLPAQYVKELTDNVVDFFKGVAGFGDVSKVTEAALGRLDSRFDSLGKGVSRLTGIWDRLSQIFDGVRGVLDKVFGYIADWFKGLGKNIAAQMKPGDFDGAVDVINVGLLGGIIILFKKFLSGGLKLDFGDGVFAKLKETLEGVTGVLKSMQTELKAKALMEIAIALGVLTVSIVALSMIDSASLSKALIAITVSFGELLGAFAALDKLSGSSFDAAKFAILSAGLNMLATASVILSVAVKNLAGLSWAELARGLTAVSVVLAAMMASTQIMAADVGGMIRAGAGMILISTGLLILSQAVQAFAKMSWGDMAKGLVGLAGGLTVITAAMNFMPATSILAAGLAMIPLATGLTILAGAVALFGHMDWGTLGKGLLGMAGALLLIVGAMNLVPISLPITAAGLVLVGIALNSIALAVRSMGSMDFGQMAKGIGALAAMMLILTVAMNAMSMGLGGAAALVVVSGALLVLAHVLEKIGGMSLKELAIGLGGIAAVLTVLGVAAALLTPVIPMMEALGVALLLIGGGFAAFGVGAMLVAKSFEIMARAGKVGMAAIIDAIKMFITAVPTFFTTLTAAVVKMGADLISAASMLLKLLTGLLLQILDTVIKLAPKIGEALVVIVTSFLKIIQSKFPEIVAVGFMMLMTFLQGLSDNMDRLTQTAIDIVLEFADTLAANAQTLVNAGVNLITAFLLAIGARASDIAGAGLEMLLAFIKGIADNIVKVVEMAGTIIISFMGAIRSFYTRITDAGIQLLVGFIKGIGQNIGDAVKAGVDVVLKFLDGVGQNSLRLVNGAADVLVQFLNGLAEAIRTHSKEIREAGENIAGALIDGVTGGLAGKAGGLFGKVGGLFKGAVDAANNAIDAHSPSREFMKIARNMLDGVIVIFDRDNSVESSVVTRAQNIVDAFSETLNTIPDSLQGMEEFQPTITPVLDLSKVRADARGLGAMMGVPEISPKFSLAQARLISTTTEQTKADAEPVQSDPKEINFTQINNSPKAISTNDVYRYTKSQIAMAKENLKI